MLSFHNRVRLFAAFVFALLLVPVARAQDVTPPERPFLWRIEGVVPSYLFGTIHLPDPRVTTLHPEVQAALDRCDALFTELEMDGGLLGGAMKRMTLPGRTKLGDVLPADLLARLEAFLAGRGMPIAPLSRLKVWVVATQVPMIDHMAEMAKGKALDMQLYERADEDGKEVGALETIDEQVGVFDGLSDAEQAQMLSDALDGVAKSDESGEDSFEKLIELYRGGDAEALMELMKESDSADPVLQSKLEETLLWARNRRMAERIDAHLRGAPQKSFVFAVGAAHMPDDRGVVALLRGRGYRVTRLPESKADIEARIRELEAELDRLRARLGALRKAG